MALTRSLKMLVPWLAFLGAGLMLGLAGTYLYLATPEDSYESLAATLRLGARGADRLRLLNGDYPRGQPRAGDWLKVIR